MQPNPTGTTHSNGATLAATDTGALLPGPARPGRSSPGPANPTSVSRLSPPTCRRRRRRQLITFGADVNAAEGRGAGPFPLMIAARNLAAPPWAHLAMGVLQLGKDTPCIELAAVVAVVRRSKWEVCHVADTLQDSKGNPLKSPTGRQLFSRTSWRFSWFGLQVYLP